MDKNIFHASMLLWGGIFCFVLGICSWVNRSKEQKIWSAVCLFEMVASLLLIFDAIARIFDGHAGEIGMLLVRFSKFCVFLLSNLVVVAGHIYVLVQIYGTVRDAFKSKNRALVWTGFVNGIVGCALVIISQFTNIYYVVDIGNHFCRNKFFWISVIIPICTTVADLILIIKCRKNIRKSELYTLFIIVLLPIVSSLGIVNIYKISFSNIAIGIDAFAIFVQGMIEQNRQLAEKEKQNSEIRVSMLLSQISPHFIYNVLNAIQYLCDANPQEAKETVGELAMYLRGNMNAAAEKENIPFLQELMHVKNYIAIEKKRFGDRIQVKYDIQFSEFSVPPLCVQMLVENAVKHGVSKKIHGGTIILRSYEKEKKVYIVVEDNGKGFDTSKLQVKDETGRVHVGIHNVRERLRIKDAGILTIESIPDVGTKAVISFDLTGKKENK